MAFGSCPASTRGPVRGILRRMAPRPLESREAFIARLVAAGTKIRRHPMRFGGHHFTHVAALEGEVWRVRRLVLDRAKADAYMREHGSFMPEHAEMLAEPGPVVLEAATLAGLVEALQGVRWPMV